MNKNSFLADLLQNIGFITAVAVAISQYSLNESFAVFFSGNEAIYKASSLVALILSIGLILGVFVLRNRLFNPIILFPWENTKYNKKRNLINDEVNKLIREKGIEEAEKYKAAVQLPTYPKSITAIGIGFVLLLLSLASFVFLISFSQTIWIGSILFICFILFSVTSISLFSIRLYNDSEYKTQRIATTEEIFNRINEFFTDKVVVVSDSQDLNNFANPIRTIFVKHPKKDLYRIDCNSYDPSRLFSIQKIKQEKIK
ncbi:MAG: hypothetical protein A2632_03205 [Candidatus Pacebacteria bacterium RIFCSPHIGHO2_01_FULL_46_16]|nr:MAG: hypothetical protein A2632_03205 [Candidatus Pacebacteria bacterium RIFCSPHIGHO2_01_FULL_46_16]OGJ38990.1 MAG: hypothetical protein A3A82_02520 [Candidatus Pacebacteria bacterium RIFCSPLOWO2_01_FULL_47_12]